MLVTTIETPDAASFLPPPAAKSEGNARSAAQATRLRFAIAEAAGALGDIGTFLPIVLGMVIVVGADAAAILVFAGLMNVITGLYFRIPIAVQPMKAVCALAIAGSVTAGGVAAGGIFVGVCMLVVGLSGLARRLDRLVPSNVIRGIQAAVGVSLFLTGLRFGVIDPETLTLLPVLGAGGILIFACTALAMLLFRKQPAVGIFALLAVGLAMAGMALPPDATTSISLWRPALVSLDVETLSGIWNAGIPQLPLTLLNSVLAVSLLARELFPAQKESSTPARIAVSVGLMNLLVCPFGGMPMCHGSGGLAAQHKFGARTKWSMVGLGGVKILIGLFLGVAATMWMNAFPRTILGVFLLMAGYGLLKASRVWKGRPTLAVGLAVVSVHLATGTLILGFAAGWLAHMIASRATPQHARS
jgi:MFS superfamily sulfate permease-like transporter